MGLDSHFLPSPVAAGFKQGRVHYDIERQLWLDSGHVEIGRFRWFSPVEDVLRNDDEVFAFSLALSPRVPSTKVVWMDGCDECGDEDMGRVTMLNPGSTFRLIAPTGKLRSLYCGIKRRELQELLGGPVDWANSNWKALLRQRLPVMELLLNRLYEELNEARFRCDLAVDTYVRALTLEVARCLKSADADDGVMHSGGLAPWRMRLLHKRIYADAPAPHLSELADLCGMTVRQLSRAFKEETNQTLGKFVDQVTVERASAMLTRSDRPVNAISAALGYATSASFAVAFRRATGMLPSQFRRRSLS